MLIDDISRLDAIFVGISAFGEADNDDHIVWILDLGS